MKKPKIILTCEHGGNSIPPEYASDFSGAKEILQSHRGYDIGALELFNFLLNNLKFPGEYSTISRLLIDLNRSPHHPNLFSEWSRKLPKADKTKILKAYTQHRNDVQRKIGKWVENGFSVLHLAVHSFVPSLNGEQRNADIGLLYDPARANEKEFCRTWRMKLLELRPDLRVRLNYPYRGNADGFTTFLRKQWSAESYRGVELEVNQGLFSVRNKSWGSIGGPLAKSLGFFKLRGW